MSKEHPFSKLRFDAVIYLGVGNGNSLIELIECVTAKTWHLLEGDNRKAKDLQRNLKNIRSGAQIILHNKIVSVDGAASKWFSYNHSDFDGLKKATDLELLYPGITLEREWECDTEALPNFLSQLNLSNCTNNLLIIDLPGQALELIKSIFKLGKKEFFTQVILTGTTEKLLEKSGTLSEIKDLMSKQGYHSREESPEDPDFPKLYYSFDKKSAVEFSKLKKRLRELIQEVDSLKNVHKHNDELRLLVEEKNSKIEYLEKILQERERDYQMLHSSKVENDSNYKKDLNNLKRALDGKAKVIKTKEQELESYKRLEANYSREFYRVEAQLELLKELIKNDKN